MPTPLKSVHDKITLIGASQHVSELEMTRCIFGEEELKKYILDYLGNGIITEITKNPEFILEREEVFDFDHSTRFRATVGVIFDLKSFEETLRAALSAEYTHGYKRALEELIVQEAEEKATRELEEVDVVLSEANALRITDE